MNAEQLKKAIKADPRRVKCRDETDGDSFLHILACRCSEEAVEMARIMIEAGLEIDALNDKGRTPFQTSVMNLNAVMIRFFAENGADVQAVDLKGRNCIEILAKWTYEYGFETEEGVPALARLYSVVPKASWTKLVEQADPFCMREELRVCLCLLAAPYSSVTAEA